MESSTNVASEAIIERKLNHKHILNHTRSLWINTSAIESDITILLLLGVIIVISYGEI